MSPSSVNSTRRLSNSDALNQSMPWSKSMPPAKLTCSLIRAASSAGRKQRSTPRKTICGVGISRMTPISSEISVGVPQPSLPMGPSRKWPSSMGKIAFRSLTIRVILATTSCGNRMLFIAPVRTPSISALVSSVRLWPSRPPTPISVKPKPSWIGMNSAVIRTRSAKPLLPSGIFVLMMPTALRSMMSWKVSSSAPKYSPFWRIEFQEAAAFDHPGIDRQSDALRRPEVEVELHRPKVAAAIAGKRDHRVEPDVLHDRSHRTEGALEVRTQSDRQPAILEADGQRHAFDGDRPKVDVGGLANFKRAAASEVQACGGIPVRADREIGIDARDGYELGDQAVAARGTEGELAADDIEGQPKVGGGVPLGRIPGEIGGNSELDFLGGQTAKAAQVEQGHVLAVRCPPRECEGCGALELARRLHGDLQRRLQREGCASGQGRPKFNVGAQAIGNRVFDGPSAGNVAPEICGEPRRRQSHRRREARAEKLERWRHYRIVQRCRNAQTVEKVSQADQDGAAVEGGIIPAKQRLQRGLRRGHQAGEAVKLQ